MTMLVSVHLCVCDGGGDSAGETGRTERKSFCLCSSRNCPFVCFPQAVFPTNGAKYKMC